MSRERRESWRRDREGEREEREDLSEETFLSFMGFFITLAVDWNKWKIEAKSRTKDLVWKDKVSQPKKPGRGGRLLRLWATHGPRSIRPSLLFPFSMLSLDLHKKRSEQSEAILWTHSFRTTSANLHFLSQFECDWVQVLNCRQDLLTLCMLRNLSRGFLEMEESDASLCKERHKKHWNYDSTKCKTGSSSR